MVAVLRLEHELVAHHLLDPVELGLVPACGVEIQEATRARPGIRTISRVFVVLVEDVDREVGVDGVGDLERTPDLVALSREPGAEDGEPGVIVGRLQVLQSEHDVSPQRMSWFSVRAAPGVRAPRRSIRWWKPSRTRWAEACGRGSSRAFRSSPPSRRTCTG